MVYRKRGRKKYYKGRAATRGAASQAVLRRGNRGYGNNGIYNFKRMFTTTATIVMNGVATNSQGAFSFKLSDLPSYTEFTALYDKYRITGIKAVWLPRINVFDKSSITGTSTETPPIYTAVDYDDDTSPTNYFDLEQYENCKLHWEFKPFKLFFRPQIAVAAYGAGAFTSYGSSRKMWIDAASPDVKYYGLKWASNGYSAANNGAQPVWDITFTYYIQCKYPR